MCLLLLGEPAVTSSPLFFSPYPLSTIGCFCAMWHEKWNACIFSYLSQLKILPFLNGHVTRPGWMAGNNGTFNGLHCKVYQLTSIAFISRHKKPHLDLFCKEKAFATLHIWHAGRFPVNNLAAIMEIPEQPIKIHPKQTSKPNDHITPRAEKWYHPIMAISVLSGDQVIPMTTDGR